MLKAANPRIEYATRLAIDVGFAEKKRSTGIYSSDGILDLNCHFGSVAGLLREYIKPPGCPVLIIIEAPLSQCYRVDNANPKRRGEFEKGRCWWVNAGATTMIAAQRILWDLSLLEQNEIYVLEGFLSNKKTRTDHKDDAQALIQASMQTPWIMPEKDWESSMRGWDLVPPVVVAGT